MKGEDPFLAVLREHFPDAEISEHENLFTGDFIDDETSLAVVDVAEQASSLKAIEEHIRAAQAAYRKLHPEVRDVLNSQFRTNSIERLSFAKRTTLVCENDFPTKGAHLWSIFEATLYSLTGRLRVPIMPDDYLPEQPSAIEAAKKRAAYLLPLTGKARATATWKKVRVVEHAIDCWLRYGTGKLRIHSNAFQGFLRDLVEVLDPKGKRGWDAKGLVRTYKGYEKKLKS